MLAVLAGVLAGLGLVAAVLFECAGWESGLAAQQMRDQPALGVHAQAVPDARSRLPIDGCGPVSRHPIVAAGPARVLVSGTVRDEGGHVRPLATVQLVAEGMPALPGLGVDEQGRFELTLPLEAAREGRLARWALHAREPELAACSLEVPLRGAHVDLGDVVLRARGRVAIRVLDPQGGVRVGSQVLLMARRPGGHGWRRLAETETDSEGRARFEVGAPLQGLLQVFGPGHVAGHSPRFDVPAGALVDLGDLMLDQGDRVSGVVRDADGQAVAGARVVLLADSELPWDVGCDDPVLRAQLALESPESPRPCESWSVSDAQGTFEVHGARPGRLALLALHPTRGRGLLRGVVAGQVGLTVHTQQAVRAHVDVVDESGAAVGSSRLRAWAVLGDQPVGLELPVSGDGGSFAVPAGGTCGQEVLVEAPGFAATRRILRGGGSHQVQLVRAAPLACSVTTDDGSPLPGVLVQARSSEGQPGSWAASDAAGRVVFTNLGPGSWWLIACAPGYSSAEAWVTLPGETLLVMQESAWLEIELLDARGSPVAGEQVRVEPGLGVTAPPQLALTDCVGRARLELPAGAWSVPQFDGMQFDLAPGQTRAVTLRRPQPGILGGRVTRAGRSVASCQVLVYSESGTTVEAEAVTADDGSWQVPLEAGVYRALAVATGDQAGRSEVRSCEVVAAGPSLLDLELGSGRVIGRLNWPAGWSPEGLEVRLVPDGPGSPLHHGHLSVKPAGREFAFEGVPAGRHRLLVQAVNALAGEWLEIEVVPGVDPPPFTLGVSPAGALTGRVVDGHGAPVVDGCQIRLEADGERRRTVTSQGRFALGSLRPGSWSVEVLSVDGARLLVRTWCDVDAEGSTDVLLKTCGP